MSRDLGDVPNTIVSSSDFSTSQISIYILDLQRQISINSRRRISITRIEYSLCLLISLLQSKDFTKPFMMKTDTSYCAKGVVLSLIGTHNKTSSSSLIIPKIITTNEINYKIYDEELLAIMDSQKQWHHFLGGTIKLGHHLYRSQNLEYFKSTCVMNPGQAGEKCLRQQPNPRYLFDRHLPGLSDASTT